MGCSFFALSYRNQSAADIGERASVPQRAGEVQRDESAST